jgi:hypothetical protein
MACAPLDGIDEVIDLRNRAFREGTALRLKDGRLIAVQVITMPVGQDGKCGEWKAPDKIILFNDSTRCSRLELMLQHELGHAYGLPHTLTGIMAPVPNEEP